MDTGVVPKEWRVGDKVFWGRYFVDMGGETKPILWRVAGQKKNRLLLVSEYCIHWLPFDVCRAALWKESLLREFLKGFFKEAFTKEEKKWIVRSRIRSSDIPYESDGPGVETWDRVFLLSVAEANEFFARDEERKATATPYAVEKGAYIAEEEQAVCWWLRDVGHNRSYAADVLPTGEICDSGDDLEEAGGVRPAMWIKVN